MRTDKTSKEKANQLFQKKAAAERALWSEIETATALARAKTERLRALRMARDAAEAEAGQNEPRAPVVGETKPARNRKGRVAANDATCGER